MRNVRHGHRYRGVAASAVLALLATPAIADARPRVAQTRLFASQLGGCAATEAPIWMLLPTAKGKPCPSAAGTLTAPGRADDSYVASVVGGKIGRAGSPASFTVRFADLFNGGGYVDAELTLRVNGVAIASKRVAGALAPAAHIDGTATGAVPPALGAKTLRSVALEVKWNVGTTPSVAPTTDGKSFVSLPVAGMRVRDGRTIAITATVAGFRPRAITVRVGDIVKVTVPASDPEPHTFSEARVFESGPILPGQSFTVTFRAPGVHDYVCWPHLAFNMVGEIRVI